ncbi:uncharacterized protein LOC133378496 isoform X1 [Rhineura floridana]|uniref:uncharacterized protein LOC133378496 isoform X1 n=1 Tax=Rhineura floridana TaxID=261503 RepID=UPI002AC82EC0|nr:uncharacterized protein LOC133378496 isoform X1 [Rhineura floridana]XP_061469318.1 uncharacterized protein LOC133378496 isoform X1 [Rhineura floridana]
MSRTIDAIAPLRPLTHSRSKVAPWFSKELADMKRIYRGLEHRWLKTRSLFDQRQARNFLKHYMTSRLTAQRAFFSAAILSADNRPKELFRVVKSLLNQDQHKPNLDHSASRCQELATYFSTKIAQIRSNLDSNNIISDIMTPTIVIDCSPTLDSFQLVHPADIDNLLEGMRPTTCPLDPCPSWIIEQSRMGLANQICEVINASLQQGHLPGSLKEAIIIPLLKKPSLNPSCLNNFHPVSNLPFLSKIIERVVASQLQSFLELTDYYDSFQSGFRPGNGTETVLVALVDDLRKELDRGRMSLLVLLDLSAAFDMIDHDILLGRLSEMGLRGTFSVALLFLGGQITESTVWGF